MWWLDAQGVVGGDGDVTALVDELDGHVSVSRDECLECFGVDHGFEWFKIVGRGSERVRHGDDHIDCDGTICWCEFPNG